MSHVHEWELVTTGMSPIRNRSRRISPEGLSEDSEGVVGILRSYICECGKTKVETETVAADQPTDLERTMRP